MKPIFKIGMGANGVFIQWFIRLILISLTLVLIYKIYPINHFFVEVSGVILFLIIILISEEKLFATNDVFIYSKSYCFNLIKIKKSFKIEEIKRVEIVDNNHDFYLNLMAFILPYMSSSYANLNEIKIIYKNGNVDKYITPICIKHLLIFEKKMEELIIEKTKQTSFSQPIFRED